MPVCVLLRIDALVLRFSTVAGGDPGVLPQCQGSVGGLQAGHEDRPQCPERAVQTPTHPGHPRTGEIKSPSMTLTSVIRFRGETGYEKRTDCRMHIHRSDMEWG